MKKNIHPNWSHQVTVTCTCGNTFTTGSSKTDLQVDICNMCHPFFTGEMKFVDRQGRVDKFLAKQKKAQAAQQALQQKASKKKQDKPQQDESKTYRDLLRQQQRTLSQKKTN